MSCFILVFLCCLVVSQSQVFDTAQHENWQYLQSEYCDGTPTSRRDDNNNLCEFPWIAGLEFYLANGSRVLCAGSILNKRTILTVAHCFYPEGYRADIAAVLLGDWNKQSRGDCNSRKCAPMEQSIRPREIIVHDGFDRLTSACDIALVRLESDIQWNQCTRPICMLKGNLLHTDFAEHSATIAGWGASNLITNEEIFTLQKTELHVIRGFQCPPSFVCAFGRSQTAETCRSDSGAPLMIQEKDETSPRPLRDYVIGMFLYGGAYCGEKDVPGRFTRVSSFAEWIMDNLIQNRRDFIVFK